MKKERKTSKLVRTIMAFTTVFSSFGTVGVMEVKAKSRQEGEQTGIICTLNCILVKEKHSR